MATKIEGYKITDGRKMIETERKRLIKIKESGKELIPWMKKQFGENLTELDGTLHAIGSRFDSHDCQVCNREISFDEKIVRFNFSFCQEYSCSMNICKKCLRILVKECNDASKQEGVQDEE